MMYQWAVFICKKCGYKWFRKYTELNREVISFCQKCETINYPDQISNGITFIKYELK